MSNNDKIEKLKNEIENEKRERKLVEERYAYRLEELSEKLTFDTREYKIQIDDLKRVKVEITGYVLKLITIVVGLLGLILTISFLGINKSNNEEFLLFCISILILFIFIFISWFYLWIRKEKIFDFVENKSYIIQKKIANYFAISIIMYLIIVIIFFIDILFPGNTPLYWFIFLFAFGLLLITMTLIRLYNQPIQIEK